MQSDTMDNNRQPTKIFGFPVNVFVLSFISFLNDIGGQTIKYAIPLFLTNTLGVKTSVIGLVEGIGDATPQLFQPLSGWITDKLKRRKKTVVLGQIFRSSILFLFFANSWLQVLFIRFLDRSGKGVQGAPRDALISLSAEKGAQGKAFGLSRTMDNAGAVVGLTLAGLITMFASSQTLSLTKPVFHLIVLLAVLPAIIAVILIALFVHDTKTIKENVNKDIKPESLGKKYFVFLFITFIFTLGNSSDAFLILRTQNLGMPLPAIFFLLAAFSLVASLLSLPMGIISDKIGRKKSIIFGWLLYALVYFGFARINSLNGIIVLFLLYGVYYGFSEGVAKAYVADIVPAEKKGTAFGIYNMVSGLTLFLASLTAGTLWQVFSPSVAFYFGGSLAVVAALIFMITSRVKIFF